MNIMSTRSRHTSSKFGESAKKWRYDHGVSQAQLAKKLGITRSYLSQVENGEPASGRLQARFRNVTAQWGSAEGSTNHGGLPNDAEIVPLRLVPLVSWAQAGQAVEYDELPVSWQKKVHTTVDDPKAFAVSIVGDSMEPRYHADDVAFLEPSRPVRQHDTVIARLKDGGVVFKIYSRTGDKVRFSSYNLAYPPFEVPVADIVWVYPVHSILKIVSK